MDDFYSGTITDGSAKFDITKTKEAIQKAEEIHLRMIKSMSRAFEGIEVRVDPELVGERYYISMSQELFDKLEKRIMDEINRSRNELGTET